MRQLATALLLILFSLAGLAQKRGKTHMETGLTDTYWRNEATGDWLIGFAEGHVIYNNKVWDVTSKTLRKDAYVLTLNDGTTVKVGKMRKGLRTITVGGKTIACSPITTEVLPDYPMTDTRKGFTDNGYRATDSVTIAGWLKGMPERAWQRGKYGGQNEMWKRLDEVRESRKPYKQRSLESLRGSENETKGKNEM